MREDQENRLAKLRAIAGQYERQKTLKAQLEFQAKVMPQKPVYKSKKRRVADENPILKPVNKSKE